jgi:MFS family permease
MTSTKSVTAASEPAGARPSRVVWAAGAATFLTSCADNFILLLLLWIAGPQGWTGVQTAAIVVILRVPSLVTGIVMGRAVDRWGARRLAAADLVIRTALLMALIGAGLGAGELPLPAVLLAGGLSGAIAPASYAAVRWSIPRTVPAARLGRANAVVGLADQISLLVGGALVGPSLALLGPVVGITVPAVMLLLAIPLARRLPGAASVAPAPRTESSASPSGGRRFPSRVWALLALSTAYYFLYGPFETATPAFVRDRMHADQGSYSLLWTVFGLGATVALPAGALLARRRPGLVNALGAAIWGVLMLSLLVLRDTAAVTVLFFVSGAVWGPYTTVENSALQRWADPSRHGALFGLQRSLLGTAAPVGAAAGAIALQRFPAHIVLAASAAACAVAGVTALLSRDLRRTF